MRKRKVEEKVVHKKCKKCISNRLYSDRKKFTNTFQKYVGRGCLKELCIGANNYADFPLTLDNRLSGCPIRYTIFQQDGAPAHKAKKVSV